MAEIDLGSSSRPRVAWIVVAFVGTLVLGALLGFSWVNAQRFELVLDGSELRVEKGRFLPWGMGRYEPHEAYAPVALPSDLAIELPVGACDDGLDCERRFYRAIVQAAGAILERARPDELELAKTLIVRAQLFPSISLAERAPIEDLAGAVHFVEALVLIEQQRDALRLTLKKLERARIAGVSGIEPAYLDGLLVMVQRQIELLEAATAAPKRKPEPSPAPNAAPDSPTSTAEGPI